MTSISWSAADKRYARQLPPQIGRIALAVLGMMQDRVNVSCGGGSPTRLDGSKTRPHTDEGFYLREFKVRTHSTKTDPIRWRSAGPPWAMSLLPPPRPPNLASASFINAPMSKGSPA